MVFIFGEKNTTIGCFIYNCYCNTLLVKNQAAAKIEAAIDVMLPTAAKALFSFEQPKTAGFRLLYSCAFVGMPSFQPAKAVDATKVNERWRTNNNGQKFKAFSLPERHRLVFDQRAPEGQGQTTITTYYLMAMKLIKYYRLFLCFVIK